MSGLCSYRALRIIAAALTCVFLAAVPGAAQRSLVIERFETTIDVAADGSIGVVEVIRPRFTGSWNGIYRSIPVDYRTPQGLNYTLRLKVDAVTDGAGNPLDYETSRERHYRKLKISVPGAYNSTQVVVIRYRVANALLFFEEHDELYWNLTGDEWQVPIESASGRVRLPEGASGVRATAFEGTYGSTERATVAIDGTTVSVTAARGLAFREGLTVVAGWNPGVVRRPNLITRITDFFYSYVLLLIPLAVMAVMYILWRVRGRDPEVAPIVAIYEPPNELTPAEVGTLIDAHPDVRDVTATIVDLAVRGYIAVSDDNSTFDGIFKDYTFRLKKPHNEWQSLKSHESRVLSGMFGESGKADDTVKMSDLRNRFYTDMAAIREDLHLMLVTRGHYARRPIEVQGAYALRGIAAGVGLWLVSAYVLPFFGLELAGGIIGGIATTIIIWGFGIQMPVRTVAGTRELEQVLGFQEFLARVDTDRLRRMTTTPDMFEKLLPYAMALGVEDNWAKAFDGLDQRPIEWYSGDGRAESFRPRMFTENLNQMSTTVAKTLTAAPRAAKRTVGESGFSSGWDSDTGSSGFSSGGGRSGGGYGGGGGGGW